MCISAATAALIAAGVGAAGSLYQADTQRKRANQAADRQREGIARAEAEAAQSANARIAMRRRALASQSLVTGGADPMAGRSTLGG